MTITNAQYTAWLAADNKERNVLAEVQAYSGGAVVTRYLSSRGFVSTASDTPANTAYDDIIVSVPSIRSTLADALRGRSVISFGNMDVDNSGGVRDSWLQDAWDGRPAVLYLGDPTWPRADYRPVFSGVIADIQAGDNATITLRLRDRQALLDVPMQTAFVGGSGSAIYQRLPIGYGEIKFAEPVLIDSTTREYQVHDGAIQSIDAVYMDGALLTAGTQYTTTLSTGKFILVTTSTGRLTVDFKGDATGSGYINTASAIAQRIVQTRAGFSAGDIDSTSAAAFASDAPGAVGVYVSEDHRTVLGVLDELITGVGGTYSINRDGKLVMSQFKAPAGPAVLTLTDDDIELGGITLTGRIVPVLSVRIGYARYYTIVDTSALPGLSAAQRQRMADAYLIARATTGATNYLLAVHGDIDYSPYAASSDASTEAARQAALWGVLRRRFRLQAFVGVQRVNLNDVIALDLSRYALGGGVLARVVGLRENLTGGSVEIEVFL